MVNQATLQLEQIHTFEDIKFRPDNCGVPDKMITSVGYDPTEGEIETFQVALPKCVRINLDNLKPFEVVEYQYKRWGVIFDNCLAIQPSNPAFPSYSGLKVFMGSPKSGFLEATFLHPVNCVSALVTSSQQLILSAYDQNGQLLSQSDLPAANLANSDSGISPNIKLSITGENIKKVTFCSFDGHFTLDEFSFCFSN